MKSYIYLTSLDLPVGEHSITVKSMANDYNESPVSNVVSYSTLPTLSAPIISLDGDILSIEDTSGVATSFEIWGNYSILVSGATSLTIDLSEQGMEAGRYILSVRAFAEGYITSGHSNVIPYIVYADSVFQFTCSSVGNKVAEALGDPIYRAYYSVDNGETWTLIRTLVDYTTTHSVSRIIHHSGVIWFKTEVLSEYARYNSYLKIRLAFIVFILSYFS